MAEYVIAVEVHNSHQISSRPHSLLIGFAKLAPAGLAMTLMLGIEGALAICVCGDGLCNTPSAEGGTCIPQETSDICPEDCGEPPVSHLNGADLNVTTDEMPICNQESVQLWNQIVDLTLGVQGYEHDPGHLGSIPAEKFAAQIDNWFPLDTRKQTLCGRLQRFNTFDPELLAEMDWNNYIIPNPPFMHLYTDALPFQGGEGAFCINDD